MKSQNNGLSPNWGILLVVVVLAMILFALVTLVDDVSAAPIQGFAALQAAEDPPPQAGGWDYIIDVLTRSLVPHTAFAGSLILILIQVVKSFFGTSISSRGYGILNLVLSAIAAVVGIVAYEAGHFERVGDLVRGLADFLPVILPLFLGGSLGSAALYRGANTLRLPGLGTSRTDIMVGRATSGPGIRPPNYR